MKAGQVRQGRCWRAALCGAAMALAACDRDTTTRQESVRVIDGAGATTPLPTPTSPATAPLGTAPPAIASRPTAGQDSANTAAARRDIDTTIAGDGSLRPLPPARPPATTIAGEEEMRAAMRHAEAAHTTR